MQRTGRGLTRTELLTTLCSVALLMTMGAVGLAADGNGARTQARSVKDGTHVKLIHQSILVFSTQTGGRYVRPGLINRLPDPATGKDIPGVGHEDVTANTTANVYSALISQNFFGTGLPISPVERNPVVSEKDDYDWEKYNPINDSYWDDSFAADLKEGSNASYAHLVIFGTRAKENWRDTSDAAFAVLGNRGPLGGEPDFESYTCGPHGDWRGNIAFADNHIELIDTFEPAAQKARVVDGEPKKDNIFAMEDGPAGGDAILSFTMAIEEEGPELQHD